MSFKKSRIYKQSVDSLLTGFLIALAVVVVSCSGGGGASPNAPTATAVPVDTATISVSARIVISFSATMKPDSLTLTGSAASESDGGVWTTTNNTDDTLTISPSAAWSEAMHTLIIDVVADNGASLPTFTLNYVVDASLPIASVMPSNNSRITGSELIVITFDESINATTLVASGSLWVNSDSGAWTMTTNVNDTLTISPAGTWPSGAINLTLDADNLVGNSLATLNLTYVVDLTSPGGIASPVNAGVLSSVESIIIVFDESMDVLSPSYSNSLSGEIGSSSWTTTTNTNDTLTISASDAWFTGAQTLDVTASDVAGNAVTLNLAYTVQLGTCSDNVQNQDETDIDCGGALCSACMDGGSCLANTDCTSSVCSSNICQAAICGDGILQVGESCDDTNANACGTCSASCLMIQVGGDCGAGIGCSVNADCTSNSCIANICQ